MYFLIRTVLHAVKCGCGLSYKVAACTSLFEVGGHGRSGRTLNYHIVTHIP